jgi:uncharacterized membrane protein YdjX (TVP38/TMEM64 family)
MKPPAEKENPILSNLPHTSSQKNGTWLPMTMAVVLLIALAALLLSVFWNNISPWAMEWYDFLSSKEKVRTWLMSFGSASPLVFIFIQSLQVVLAPIPGEATGFLGGFLFGIPKGFLYSTVGLTLGSILAFLLGRWLEIHFVEKIVRKETLEKFDFIIERQGVLIAFLLFLIPGFPKDYLCFILGLSKMPLRIFLVINIIGRMPGTLLLTLQGANVYKGNYISFFILLGIFFLAGLFMLLYKETLYRWLRHWSKKNGVPYGGVKKPK